MKEGRYERNEEMREDGRSRRREGGRMDGRRKGGGKESGRGEGGLKGI